MAKTFKETAVGKFLAGKGFSKVLDAVGTVVPGVKILNDVKEMVLGTPEYKQMTPEDQQLFLQLHEAELKELDLRLADVQNARQREVELAKAGKKDWVMSVVILLGVTQWIGCVLFTMFFTVPDGSKEIFHDFSLTVRDIAFMIFAYYVGSSKGGRDVTKQLMNNPK